MIGIYDEHDLHAIDHAYPVDWSDPLCAGLKLWCMVLPGIGGGNRLHNLVDMSNGPHGTLVNLTSSAWQPRAHPGGFGSLLSDDTNGGATIPATAIGTSANYASTFSYWLNVVNPSHRDSYVFGGDVNTVGINHDIAAHTAYLYNGGVYTTFDYLSVGESEWRHFALTRVGTDVTLYLNGKLFGTGTYNYAASWTITYLGRRFDGLSIRQHIDGWIFHDRALSATEISDVYHDSLAGHPRMLKRLPRVSHFVQSGFAVPVLDEGMLAGGLMPLGGGLL